MKKRDQLLLAVVAFSGVLSALYTNMSRPILTTHVDIYMSPNGSDTKDGLSPTNAILTLNRAHQIAAARLKTAPTDIQINVAPGVYYNQSITWTAVHPDYYVVIAASKPASKPIFDGRLDANQTLGERRSFFTLSARGFLSNLTLKNISVRYYAEAVTFSGNREDFLNGYNGNNKILFSTFDRIGSLYHKVQDAPAYAAVRFVNSRFNQLKGNVFTNIRNKTRPELLHSIYAANSSSHNQIEGNTFRLQGGDPLRIRDFSNFNTIWNNEFDNAGAYGYSEWYCEKASNSDCTKVVPECPSWGNIFKTNILKNVGTFHLYVNPIFNVANSACKTPIPAEAEGRRLRTSSNGNATKFVVVSFLNNQYYYGVCASSNTCVSSSGGCYADGTGTTSYACSAKTWYRCSTEADVGQVRSGARCAKSGTTYAWVY